VNFEIYIKFIEGTLQNYIGFFFVSSEREQIGILNFFYKGSSQKVPRFYYKNILEVVLSSD